MTSKTNCPNKHNHTSAFPAFDLERCPYCQDVYVRKAEYKGENGEYKSK